MLFHLLFFIISLREGLLNSMQLQLHANYTQLHAGPGVEGIGWVFFRFQTDANMPPWRMSSSSKPTDN